MELRPEPYPIPRVFLVLGQYFWKKLAPKPSGLGDFNGPICFNASNTSSLVNFLSSASFISSVALQHILLGVSSRTALVGMELWNRAIKYSRNVVAISISFSMHPSSVIIFLIWFFYRRWFVQAWKNLVFLSPSRYHCLLVRCFQLISSFSLSKFNSICRTFISGITEGWCSCYCNVSSFHLVPWSFLLGFSFAHHSILLDSYCIY